MAVPKLVPVFLKWKHCREKTNKTAKFYITPFKFIKELKATMSLKLTSRQLDKEINLSARFQQFLQNARPLGKQ